MGRPKKPRPETEPEDGKPPFQAPALRADMRRHTAHPRFVVTPYDAVTGARQDYSLTPEGVEQVRTWSEQGVTIGSMANGLGISSRCFLDIRERQPEVQAAIDAGRADYTTRIADMLMKHTEEGNVTTLLFLAKTRAGFVEQEGVIEGATPKSITNNTQINITMPPAMTDEQFAELRKLTAGAVPLDLTPTEAKPKVLK